MKEPINLVLEFAVPGHPGVRVRHPDQSQRQTWWTVSRVGVETPCAAERIAESQLNRISSAHPLGYKVQCETADGHAQSVCRGCRIADRSGSFFAEFKR